MKLRVTIEVHRRDETLDIRQTEVSVVAYLPQEEPNEIFRQLEIIYPDLRENKDIQGVTLSKVEVLSKND